MIRKKHKHSGKKRETKIFLNNEKESDQALEFFRVQQSKGYAPEQEKTNNIIRVIYYIPKKDIYKLFKE